MNFIKYDEKVAIKVAREEGIEKGIIMGKEETQNYILGLIDQGLSGEEIKKKIKKMSKKITKTNQAKVV
jgi:hypothetical protein